MTAHRLETLFPRQLEARLLANPILVLPFGTLEWHSHHLPLGLDGLVAEQLAMDIADRADAVVAPVSYWAVGGVPYPHTLNLPMALLEPLYEALLSQFAGMGFKLIVCFTGHFGLEQTLAIKRAALTTMRRLDCSVLALAEYDPVTDIYAGDHAGIGETSLLWAQRPDLIALDAVEPDAPLEGIIGDDPRGRASKAWGVKLGEAIASRSAEMARRMLEEVGTEAQARYRDALEAAVHGLELTHVLRGRLGKAAVPPVTTPDYLAHCTAMQQGDYVLALQLAATKLDQLQSLATRPADYNTLPSGST